MSVRKKAWWNMGWLLLGAPAWAVQAPSEDVRALVRHLDMTSFPNSIGPRREPDRHHFADYGFTRISWKADGAELELEDRSWLMSVKVLARHGRQLEVCLVDRALAAPGAMFGDSYHVVAALRVAMSDADRWRAEKVHRGLPGCINDPPDNRR